MVQRIDGPFCFAIVAILVSGNIRLLNSIEVHWRGDTIVDELRFRIANHERKTMARSLGHRDLQRVSNIVSVMRLAKGHTRVIRKHQERLLESDRLITQRARYDS